MSIIDGLNCVSIGAIVLKVSNSGPYSLAFNFELSVDSINVAEAYDRGDELGL